MVYAGWWSALGTPDKDGNTPRASYEALAARGRPDAIRMLAGPPLPDAVEYLWQWAQEIRRGLGFDMHGLAAMSWGAIDAWCRLTGQSLEPDEVRALLSLDAVMRHPESLGDAAFGAAWT